MIYARDFQDKKEYSFNKKQGRVNPLFAVAHGIYVVVSGEFHLVFVLVQNIRVVELRTEISHHALHVLFAKFCLFFFFFVGKSDGFCFFGKFVYSFDV